MGEPLLTYRRQPCLLGASSADFPSMPDQNKIDEWLAQLEGIWTEGGSRGQLPQGARADDDRLIEGLGNSHGAIVQPNDSVQQGPGVGTEVRIKFTRGE